MKPWLKRLRIEKKMYKNIHQEDSGVVKNLKAEHLETLVAPLDAYWEEALIGFADHNEIEIESRRAGYYCLNGDNQLVAFFLSKAHARHGGDILSNLIKEHDVKAALTGTNDPYFLSLCLDIATSTSVHTLLFQDNEKVTSEPPGFDVLTFEVAMKDDFDEIFKNYCGAGESMDAESVETGFEDLKGYIRSVMDDHQIFVLRENGKLIATSECRISKTQKPYADVGMIVAVDQRRRGVGGHVLNLTKDFCYERGLQPICSCEAGNIGSRKAITKAGFVSRHRVLLVEFARRK